MPTYAAKKPKISLDSGGTPVVITSKATSVGIEANPNFASHPRTGDAAPFDQYIDATYECVLKYVHGYGTDGVFAAFAGLEGQEVECEIETVPGTSPTVDAPSFTFTATIPAVSPLPETDQGEFAVGEVTIPIKGVPVTVTV